MMRDNNVLRKVIISINPVRDSISRNHIVCNGSRSKITKNDYHLYACLL